MTATICVVDDSPDQRLLLTAMLGSDFAIVEFEDGERAIEGITAAPPDLVFLDITLPGIDGTEVVRRLRADAGLRGLPVIALTGHARPEDTARFLEAGFDECVAKPIRDPDALTALARRWIATGRD